MGVYLFLGWLWGNNLFSTSDRLLKITLTYHLNLFGLVTPPGNLYILKTLLIPIYTLLPSIIFLIAVNVKGSSISLTDVAFWKWTFHGAFWIHTLTVLLIKTFNVSATFHLAIFSKTQYHNRHFMNLKKLIWSSRYFHYWFIFVVQEIPDRLYILQLLHYATCD